ncbi:MAG: hypothetical protein QY317_14040 [Candidatus Jettenia caeni]|nr:MAG: hypothetical protein QY317_14040 [Candidatus Jettenia caeni]
MIKYIGLDAHSSTCTFNVTDERGREADNTTIESNGRLLVKYLRGIEGVKKLTFEEVDPPSFKSKITMLSKEHR